MLYLLSCTAKNAAYSLDQAGYFSSATTGKVQKKLYSEHHHA